MSVTLLGFEQLREQPDPRWLIDGLLPDDGLAVMFGASAAGKSFVALDWALSVATGRAWFGHRIERPGYVVYIAAEGRAGIKARAEAWWRAHGRPDPSRARFALEPVNLRRPPEIADLRRAIEELPERPRLLVVDTLARCLVGRDESAARDVGEAIAALDGLPVDVRLLLHHVGHNGSHERGSSALQGAADLRVKIEHEGRSRQRTLCCEKCKDAAEWEPVTLSLDPQPEGSCVLSQIVEVEAKRDELRDEVLAHVEEHGPVSGKATAAALHRRRESVIKALRALVEAGAVEETADGYKGVPTAREHPRNTPSAAPGGPCSPAPPLPFGEGGREHPRAEAPDSERDQPGTPSPPELDTEALAALPPLPPDGRRDEMLEGDERDAYLAEHGWSDDELEEMAATQLALEAERT